MISGSTVDPSRSCAEPCVLDDAKSTGERLRDSWNDGEHRWTTVLDRPRTHVRRTENKTRNHQLVVRDVMFLNPHDSPSNRDGGRLRSSLPISELKLTTALSALGETIGNCASNTCPLALALSHNILRFVTVSNSHHFQWSCGPQ